MNILENITYQNDKPSVAIINKTEKLKYFAVALGNAAVLQKHKAPVPSTLVVTKGEIEFKFADRSYHLKTFDVFDIPVDEEHEVLGLQDENLFFVTQVF